MKSMMVGDIPIAYLDEGTGPPVILVHCSSGSNRMWRQLIDELKGSYRVIAPDLIGYGRSGRWPASQPFDISVEARVLTLLASLADEPAHFVGHSYGGAMALEAVRLLGGVARGMTLIEPVAFQLLRPAGKNEAWAEIAGVVEGVTTAMARGDKKAAAGAYMGFWLGKVKWWMSPRKLRDNIIETVDKVALEFRAIEAMPSASLQDYAALDMPALLIHGAKTRLPAIAVLEVLAGLLPQARIEQVDGAGHMSPITHRDEVNALVLSHIEACAATPAGRIAPRPTISTMTALPEG
jgi:pimeloyl-ACP methyl ester carboxylesterase